MDQEIVERVGSHLHASLQMNKVKRDGCGRANPYYIKDKLVTYPGQHKHNGFMEVRRRYNLWDNKHIPQIYLCGPREVRFQLLAGLIDTDGTRDKNSGMLSITQKHEHLLAQIVNLARSLGFPANKSQVQKKCCNNGVIGTYYSTSISGVGQEHVPVALERKRPPPRKHVKDVLRTGLDPTSIGPGCFYGFTLDGNHKYLDAAGLVHSSQ